MICYIEPGDPEEYYPESYKCELCSGTGKFAPELFCPDCDGRGVLGPLSEEELMKLINIRSTEKPGSSPGSP